MMEVVVTTGAISRAKLQSHHHHQQTKTKFFTGWMHFLTPNQQCQSTEGKNITFDGLAYPKLTWGLPTLSLTTNSSWLPVLDLPGGLGGRVRPPGQKSGPTSKSWTNVPGALFIVDAIGVRY